MKALMLKVDDVQLGTIHYFARSSGVSPTLVEVFAVDEGLVPKHLLYEGTRYDLYVASEIDLVIASIRAAQQIL